LARSPVKKGRSADEIERLINERVAEFVADITELARELAVETVQKNLQQPFSLERKKSGGKRSPEELEAVCELLYEYLTENPNQRMEEIAEGMGMSSRELSLPLRKLLEQKRVRGKGRKRATTYAPTRRR
jgi:hypothetical protein